MGIASVVLLYLILGEDRAPDTSVPSSKRSVEPSTIEGRPNNTIDKLQNKDTSSTKELFGNMWEICGISEFPSEIGKAKTFVFDQKFEISDECSTALATHVLSINPFKEHIARLFGSGYEFSLFVLENPMTYARVFSDPTGDLERVINALSRSECKLEQNGKNWELKESCDADAFTNYAVFYKTCHGWTGISQARYYFYSQQDTFVENSSETITTDEIWKGFLERAWVDKHCSTFDPELELSSMNRPRVFEQLVSLHTLNYPNTRDDRELLSSKDPQSAGLLDIDYAYAALLKLGARLGDEAAALTREGRYVGVFSTTFMNPTWKSFEEEEKLSKDKIRKALNLAVILEGDGVNVDWNWLVNSVCTSQSSVDIEQCTSCRSLINSIYMDFTSDLGTRPATLSDARQFLSSEEIEKILDEVIQKISIGEIMTSEDKKRFLLALDRFSEVAMSLDVYE